MGATESHAHAEITIEDVRAAREDITPLARRTPMVSSAALSDLTGSSVVLKAENLQRTGSFKIRGALAKLASLGRDAGRGVVAGSAGNHAQALALAARTAGVPCEIFVPIGAPVAKVEACRDYGATVIERGDALAEAVQAARDRAEEAGMTFCHPFDDPVVVAGQGTLGLEVAEDVADLRRVIVPLGGGGLASGVAIAVRSLRPDVEVIGVQANACAPYAGAPGPSGPITTLADGIAVKQPGALTGPLVERWLHEVVTVDEDSIADAMVLLMERAKLYVEGAGAVGVAALLAGCLAPADEGTTCVVLSGGNVDLGVVPGLIRRHETQAGRRLIVYATITDQPGGLAQLLGVFAAARANIIEVAHVREGIHLHVRETGLMVTLEVRDADHAGHVVQAGEGAGFSLERVGWTSASVG